MGARPAGIDGGPGLQRIPRTLPGLAASARDGLHVRENH
jgi:hypothetical protein